MGQEWTEWGIWSGWERGVELGALQSGVFLGGRK